MTVNFFAVLLISQNMWQKFIGKYTMKIHSLSTTTLTVQLPRCSHHIC